MKGKRSLTVEFRDREGDAYSEMSMTQEKNRRPTDCGYLVRLAYAFFVASMSSFGTTSGVVAKLHLLCVRRGLWIVNPSPMLRRCVGEPPAHVGFYWPLVLVLQ